MRVLNIHPTVALVTNPDGRFCFALVFFGARHSNCLLALRSRVAVKHSGPWKIRPATFGFRISEQGLVGAAAHEKAVL